MQKDTDISDRARVQHTIGEIEVEIKHNECVFVYGDEYCGCISEEPCGKTFDTCKNKPRYGGFPTVKAYSGDGEEVNMKIIKLEKSDKVATVDDIDFDELSKIAWRYEKNGNNEYARSGAVYMHRYIMDVVESKDIQIDHRNGNGLCNERWNLRTCTNQQNCNNRPSKPCSASKYKGVFKHKDNKGIKWRARIEHNGKAIHLGYFRIEDDAAIAYNKKATELFGEFAYLNIIEEGEQSCQ